jgi:uncharacterized Zn finger protein
MYQILGRCSQCGGNVVVPTIWHGIIPPTPRCESCGAVKKQKVIETVKSDYEVKTVTNYEIEIGQKK